MIEGEDSMQVVETLKAQRKSIEAKVEMLKEEIADIDVALKAIEARQANRRAAPTVAAATSSGPTPVPQNRSTGT